MKTRIKQKENKRETKKETTTRKENKKNGLQRQSGKTINNKDKPQKKSSNISASEKSPIPPPQYSICYIRTDSRRVNIIAILQSPSHYNAKVLDLKIHSN